VTVWVFMTAPKNAMGKKEKKGGRKGGGGMLD